MDKKLLCLLSNLIKITDIKLEKKTLKRLDFNVNTLILNLGTVLQPWSKLKQKKSFIHTENNNSYILRNPQHNHDHFGTIKLQRLTKNHHKIYETSYKLDLQTCLTFFTYLNNIFIHKDTLNKLKDSDYQFLRKCMKLIF